MRVPRFRRRSVAGSSLHQLPFPVFRRAAVGAVLLVTVGGISAEAQGTIRGVLFDSLRTNGPLADATVVLIGASRRTTTDARGRFDFADVPAGTHSVAFWAPWLDSIGVPALRAEVTVRDRGSAVAMLGTPSRSTVQVAMCGTMLEEGQGILIGEIRGPDGLPLASIGVSARWTETMIGQGMFERQMVATADSSDASGMYALCGLPVGDEVALKAVSPGQVASGEILYRLEHGIGRRDLGVSPPSVVARVSGRVVGPDGAPIENVRVVVGGDSSLVGRTDADGRFSVANVPRRSTQFVARTLGFVPYVTNVELTDADVDVGDIALDRIPPELATVTVTGRPMTAGELEFDTRRNRGTGMFITEEQLARIPIPTAASIASLAPRARAEGRMLVLPRVSVGGGQISVTCRPRFFVDGFDNGYAIDVDEEEQMFRRAKRIEIYQAHETPPRYNDFNGCGVVLIWTR